LPQPSRQHRGVSASPTTGWRICRRSKARQGLGGGEFLCRRRQFGLTRCPAAGRYEERNELFERAVIFRFKRGFLICGGLGMQLKAILQRVPDPRGKQGQDYKLWSILGLIILSLLCGRRGMKAAFVLGRSLTRRQKARLGFVRGKSPCHATLTETLRVIDAQALADVLGSLGLQQSGGAQHIASDGKTMRASKDSNGRAEHVLSAFCGDLQTVLGHEASRGKGLEIPDALKLLEWLDVKGKIVTG